MADTGDPAADALRAHSYAASNAWQMFIAMLRGNAHAAAIYADSVAQWQVVAGQAKLRAGG